MLKTKGSSNEEKLHLCQEAQHVMKLVIKPNRCHSKHAMNGTYHENLVSCSTYRQGLTLLQNSEFCIVN